jgi:hypothetical protein
LSLGSLDDTILLNTSRMRGVRIDPVTRSVKVGGGATWGEVATAAAEYGLAGLAGSSPTVGVVGYSLGGGIGWLARRYGLAANSILAADLVTADARYLRVEREREREPDLLWAIRGGGGSFAIITALDIALYPVREVYGGLLLWPSGHAHEILRAWRAWTDGLPDELTSIARLRKMPSRPHIPEHMWGQTFVIVEAAYTGPEAHGTELLRPLRALSPEIDTFKMVPMTELGPIHMDPQQPMPRIGDGHRPPGNSPRRPPRHRDIRARVADRLSRDPTPRRSARASVTRAWGPCVTRSELRGVRRRHGRNPRAGRARGARNRSAPRSTRTLARS